MLQQDFANGLKILSSLDLHDLEAAAVIDAGDAGAWADFSRNPYRWLLTASDHRAEALWSLIEQRQPARDFSEETADALHEIGELAQSFGWDSSVRLWQWLRARLESYGRHDERVQELLAASNDLQQQARAARADATAWRREYEMYSNAWLRELDGRLFNKRHRIDALVKTTRHMVQRARHADRLDAIAAGMRRGVYVASKVRHAPTWKIIRAAGLPIVSTWIDEAGPVESADLARLWQRCVNEASSAEVLIVLREPNELLKGAWVEIGAALASGVPVFAVGIEGLTLAHHPSITHFHSLDEAVDAARRFLAKPAAA